MLNRIAPLFAVVLVVAGCAADTTSIGTPGTGTATSTLGATAGSGSSTADAPSFNPFSDQPASATGGRVVIANPTQADIMKPMGLPEMAQGRADAPVTLIQYASLTCPHCRAFHRDVYPQLKRELIETGKVRYILREFPIGKQSGNAAIALRCAPPAKYFELYGKFMEQQASWVSQEVRLDPIFAVAQQVGMKRAEFDQCLQNQGMINALKEVKEHGRALGIIGTPNFFIDSKLVKGTLTMADIQAAVAGRGAPAGVAANAAPVR